jgi:hypothetical protein
MSKVKVSQHTALMIEVLRANGITDQDLIHYMKQGDIDPFKQIGEGHFDFAELLDFAREHWEQFERAVRDGYQITFNTINGIKYLLSVKFNQIADRDYENKGTYLDRLKLKQGEIDWLRSVLSKYWYVVELEDQPQEDWKLVKIEMMNKAQALSE